MSADKHFILNHGPFDEMFIRRLRALAIVLIILILCNGVSDLVYAYSPTLSGRDYFSPALWNVIRTAGGRSHWMVMLAQTSGWFFPFYALIYYLWWMGMRKAGFWLSAVPTGLLAYATLMMAGTVHTGMAYLSVLSQTKAVVGSHDQMFYKMASRFIVEDFIRANLTVVATLILGTVWHAAAILSGKTVFPRWFVVFSPLMVTAYIMAIGALLPAPLAGFVLAPLPTWFMFFPTLASAIWLRRTIE